MYARDGNTMAGESTRRRGVRFALALLLLFALAGRAAAAEPAGRVISLAGAVTATDEDGHSRALEHGDAVFAGDTLALETRAHAQLRMRDDALLELEADSRFAIERYDARAGDGNVLMRLLRGAMRTITGAIGDSERDDYAVETPVATIGVRGTQYALHFCAADCAGEDRAQGLYGRVDAGAVAAVNDAATRQFVRNQYFYVAAADVPPREIVRPPEGVLDGGAVSQGELVAPEEDLAEDGAVGDPLEGTTETLGDTVEKVGSGTGDALGDLGGAVGETIGGGTGDAVGSLTEGAGAGVESLGEGAGGTIDSLGSGELGDATESLTDGTGDAVEELTDGTENALEDAGDSLDDLL